MNWPIIAIVVFMFSSASAKETVTVGSKVFTEGYILSELIAQVIESVGEVEVIRKFGLGGTGVLFQAIENGSVDIYPEYSGTVEEEILKSRRRLTSEELETQLLKLGLVTSNRLGFDNTYAIAVRREVAEREKLESIDDLERSATRGLDLRFGFSHEFVERTDGLPKVEKVYGFYLTHVSSMEHALAYEAIRNDQVDGTDVYSTDAKIKKFGLKVLRDDRGAFPEYSAFFLARVDFPKKFPKSWAALQSLRQKISEHKMRDLNAQVELDRKSVPQVVFSNFKQEGFDTHANREHSSKVVKMVALRTRQHLTLVLTSLIAAIVVGVPLGIASAKWNRLGAAILSVSSVLQTIPSLALLVFLIPLFGIGVLPALVALFLYALLPIIANTYAGLNQIDPLLLETERALGLSPWQRLRLIEIPLASPLILGGIRTSAIIGIGTATLAALIGAGGYGAPILVGLTLNDLPMILEGAVPSAVLALITQGFFEILLQTIVPRGIRSA